MFESILVMIAVFASFMLMVSVAIATSVIGFFVNLAYSFAEMVVLFFMDILLWFENLLDPAMEVFIVLAL